MNPPAISPILVTKQQRAGHLTLNRPKDRQSINVEMVEAIEAALHAWRNDRSVEFVLIDHTPASKDFCAGENVNALWEDECCLKDALLALLRSVYRLCGLIASYPKPIVAVMDGEARGCGVGLFLNTTFQVATERTGIAFPETGLGTVPSAGATWLLSRLQSQIGTWLVMTGSRIAGSDIVGAGLASHFCHEKELDSFKLDLLDSGLSALERLPRCRETSFAEQLPAIESRFSGDCAHTILRRLHKSDAWGQRQASKMAAKSPLSTKIALRQLRTGRYLDAVEQAFILEHRILYRLLRTRNYHEGHRAGLIDKDHCADWRPASLMGVTYDMVSAFYSPLGHEELSFRSGGDVCSPNIDLAQAF